MQCCEEDGRLMHCSVGAVGRCWCSVLLKMHLTRAAPSFGSDERGSPWFVRLISVDYSQHQG